MVATSEFFQADSPAQASVTVLGVGEPVTKIGGESIRQKETFEQANRVT